MLKFFICKIWIVGLLLAASFFINIMLSCIFELDILFYLGSISGVLLVVTAFVHIIIDGYNEDKWYKFYKE